LLGAAALGDIGEHFPNTDPRWQGEPSLTFLRHASVLLREGGWSISNVDATCIAESPKIMKRSSEIRDAVARALEIAADSVSVKATTNERMGFVGRGEGIAAFAVATIERTRARL
jgi:2-C-methyl-D-erythritol 2,4-cyclodiphosphate synthase